MTRFFLALVAIVAGCNDSFYFLRGTLNGDCDPPRTIMTDAGMPDPATLRKSNCQPANSVCCRRSAKAARTSCQYPEDCYIAPYQGLCVTAVDCSDTQTCISNHSCQCQLGGPPCEDLTTHKTVCCTTGQVCTLGMCGTPTGATDGGT
jgi:hypothetical protein